MYASSELSNVAVPGEDSVAAMLDRKERSLQARETSLASRENELSLAENRIREQISKNEALRTEIVGLLEDMDEQHSDKMRNEIRVFERMRSGRAAAILEVADDDVSLVILKGMRAERSARVLGEMRPAIAAHLTEKMSAHPSNQLESR